MDERSFVDGSRQIWERLAASVERARTRGVVNLDTTELRTLHEDYRRSAADLAYARTHFPASSTEAYLNELIGQAHGELYGSTPRRLGAVWEFLAVGYPRLVREYWRSVALSAALMLGAVALGMLLAYVNYPLARLFVPEALRDGVGDRIEQGAQVSDVASAIAPVLTAGITANNIQVALLAFAGGMTFGAVTAYALLANGLLLGALAGSFTKAGGSLFFWSMILPHGSLELPAIILAGASGLVLARALVSPGDLPRSAALKAASPGAVRLVLGALPLFVIAGIIEGFFTPSPVDPALKLAFGVLMMLALAAYLALPGRGERTALSR